MGWHDDGVAMGLWGKSGIPRGLNSSSWNSDSYHPSKADKSEKKRSEKSTSSGDVMTTYRELLAEKKRSEKSTSSGDVMTTYRELLAEKKRSEKSTSSGERFSKSEEMAQAMGFELVYDDRAFNGRYFHKNKKLWIHDIKALKHSLSITSDKQLEGLGYDVDTYYHMATFGKCANATSMSLEEAWEELSELEAPEGSELKVLSAWMKGKGLSASVRFDLVNKVRVEILGWKPQTTPYGSDP